MVNVKAKSPAVRIALCALFVALIVIGAQISVPVYPVPFTLQTLFVLMCGAMLGGVEGLICVAVYVFMGLVGLPVFAGWKGGIASAVSPTFGFTIGFAVGAFLTGVIAGRKGEAGWLRLTVAVLVGTVSVYVCGISYYLVLKTVYFGEGVDFFKILLTFWIMFIPSDVLKGVAVVVAAKKTAKILK